MAKMCTFSELVTKFGSLGWASTKRCATKSAAESQSNYKITVRPTYDNNQLFALDDASLATITYEARISGNFINNTGYGLDLYLTISTDVVSSGGSTYTINSYPSNGYSDFCERGESLNLAYLGDGRVSVDLANKPSYLAAILRVQYNNDQQLNAAVNGEFNSDSFNMTFYGTGFNGYESSVYLVFIAPLTSQTSINTNGYVNIDGNYNKNAAVKSIGTSGTIMDLSLNSVEITAS